jgi:hypothetical protein
MKAHKWAEEIKAWANGAEIEQSNTDAMLASHIIWKTFDGNWNKDGYIYRIKPPEVPQWRKDMAQALKDGKVVEYGCFSNWVPSLMVAEDFLSFLFSGDEKEYRIKPEPKPDVVRFYNIRNGCVYISDPAFGGADLRLIWDGETGKPKSAEVLK